jgi:hypothetical protein
VPEWLADGWVSLVASQRPTVDPDIAEPRLREIVADAYRHKNYSVREKLTDEFDAFLRQIREDDYLLTMHRRPAASPTAVGCCGFGIRRRPPREFSSVVG